MRESFVIHSEYIEDLPKDYKTKFLVYVYNFGIHGILPKCEGLELALWKKIQRRIEGDAAQYQESVLKNRCYVLQNKVKNNKATENEKELLEKYQKELSIVKLNKLNVTKHDLATYTPGVSDNEFDSVFDTDTDNDIDIDSVSDNEYESEYVSDPKKTLSPSLEEIKNFINEKNLNVNADDFFEYYAAENWNIKSWKQKLLDWNKIEKKENARLAENVKFWEKKVNE